MFTKTKTLDGILAGFRKTVDDLGAFIAEEHDKANDLMAKAANLEEEVTVHRVDAVKAQKIQQNVRTLIEG